LTRLDGLTLLMDCFLARGLRIEYELNQEDIMKRLFNYPVLFCIISILVSVAVTEEFESYQSTVEEVVTDSVNIASLK
jgi:hypothetical protein